MNIPTNNNLYQLISKHQPFDEKEKQDQEIMLDFLAHNKDALLRNNKIAHFTASAWIVNKTKTKVLMAFHKIYNSWSWVGGHADGDENLPYVAEKEAKEETGLTKLKPLMDDIYALNIITVHSHTRRGELVNSHLHFDAAFLFEADESDTIRIKPDENSGIKWFDLKTFNNYVTEEEMRPIYDRLNKKLFEIYKLQ